MTTISSPSSSARSSTRSSDRTSSALAADSPRSASAFSTAPADVFSALATSAMVEPERISIGPPASFRLCLALDLDLDWAPAPSGRPGVSPGIGGSAPSSSASLVASAAKRSGSAIGAPDFFFPPKEDDGFLDGRSRVRDGASESRPPPPPPPKPPDPPLPPPPPPPGLPRLAPPSPRVSLATSLHAHVDVARWRRADHPTRSARGRLEKDPVPPEPRGGIRCQRGSAATGSRDGAGALASAKRTAATNARRIVTGRFLLSAPSALTLLRGSRNVINSTEWGGGTRPILTASQRRGFGMNLSRCNYTSKVAHLRIYRQTHADDTRGNLPASPAVMCRRPARSKRRGARRRGLHRRDIHSEAPPPPSAHRLITPENTRRHDTGRSLGDDGHERRDLLGLERGVLHLLAVAVRRGVLRGRGGVGRKRSATRCEGSSPGPSAPDAVGSVETRRGSRLRDVGERSRGERREIRRLPVIPRAFPFPRLGFQGLGPIWIEWAGRARRWSSGAPSWGGSWCGAWWPWG